jgi:hypothetical protein
MVIDAGCAQNRITRSCALSFVSPLSWPIPFASFLTNAAMAASRVAPSQGSACDPHGCRVDLKMRPTTAPSASTSKSSSFHSPDGLLADGA